MSEKEYSNKKRTLKLTAEDIEIIEKELCKDHKVELYRVHDDTVAIASLKRKKLK